MIPLAQLLADQSDDEFVPFRAPARRPAPAPVATRPLQSSLPRITAPAPARAPAAPAKALAAPSRQQAQLRPVTEPRVPLRELEAEREAWAAEREALIEEREAALADVRRQAAEETETLRQDLERVSADRIEELRRQLAAEHGATLQDTRRNWVENEGDRLADLVILQMAVFEDALKSTLNSLLRPLVLDARKRQTVDELAGAVKTIAFDGSSVKIAASGPSDLLQALESKLGDHARHVSFDTNETDTDVRIDANQTVIETRLAAWLKAVEEALS
ncbi:hypothetical protein NS226_14950 [Aureimonas ureilytica]|uniref:Uncharacterized protein n=1 Tax=Aureimonas ureilytica TaxID=401562 RepID=A0A175R8I6_9HYPH|nr:hypothetical protein [Aureimonas ureilytica]KTQ94135.1 hypothetical protein NS226_14950 [Aureimonas ureilytica]